MIHRPDVLRPSVSPRLLPLVVVAAALLCGLVVWDQPAVAAERAANPWPPVPDEGLLFAHYGEEHLDDADGQRILPRVIRDTAAYRPAMVTMSADKGEDGTVEILEEWKHLMETYDEAGVPFFPAVGNHDRKAKPGFPEGVDPTGSLANFEDVFADRPYPFGDAPGYDDPMVSPSSRPASDPPGASSHYFVDYGPVRWIFIDNSCFSITNCDPFQNPSFPDAAGNSGQFEFLQNAAAEAESEGRLAFVVMHMPTQDDRPGHVEPTPAPHTMGEGSSPDNQLFEQIAATAGIDGVFMGHIKGQWRYQGLGGVPYYTDGGAGGEVYVGPAEETGVDSGYWHGYRLIHVVDGEVARTETVPVFTDEPFEMDGPKQLAVGERGQFTAVGQQPTVEGPDVKLELRPPDPSASNAAKLPTPSYIWATRDRRVLRPVAAADEDARANPKRQTVSGRFEGRCPGSGRVRVKSGYARDSINLTVSSEPGPIAEPVERGVRSLRTGDRRVLASVRLRQPARVIARVKRRGETVKVLKSRCMREAKRVRVRWSGYSKGRPVAPGRYRVKVRIPSDRKTVIERYRLQVR